MAAETVDGSMLLDTIERCYFGFRRRRRDVRQATSCECNACARIPDLDLKFVVHHGEAIRQKVAGRQELLGLRRDRRPPAAEERRRREAGHRRLRADQPGRASTPSDIDPAALGMRPHTETYDRIGDVPAWALDLERRWQEEEARGRVFVTPEESILIVSVPTNVPPQVAWEFITKPGQRMTLAAVGDRGRRRGGDRRPARSRLGQPLHARQGRGGRGDPRLAPVRLRHGSDGPRHADRPGQGAPHGRVRTRRRPGTTIHIRYAAPKTKREKALMDDIGPAYGAALRVGASQPRRPAGRRARCARGGPRTRAGARPAKARTGRWPGSSHW